MCSQRFWLVLTICWPHVETCRTCRNNAEQMYNTCRQHVETCGGNADTMQTHCRKLVKHVNQLDPQLQHYVPTHLTSKEAPPPQGAHGQSPNILNSHMFNIYFLLCYIYIYICWFIYIYICVFIIGFICCCLTTTTRCIWLVVFVFCLYIYIYICALFVWITFLFSKQNTSLKQNTA